MYTQKHLIPVSGKVFLCTSLGYWVVSIVYKIVYKCNNNREKVPSTRLGRLPEAAVNRDRMTLPSNDSLNLVAAVTMVALDFIDEVMQKFLNWIQD